MKTAEQFLDYCSSGQASFYVDAISSNTQGSLRQPVMVDLTPDEKVGNSLYDEAARKQKREEALELILKMLASDLPDGGGTDLLGGIVSIADVFEGQAKSEKNLLVLSDGFQSAAPFNLSASALTEHGIEDLIALARDRGMLPRMKGVKVHWVGLGAGVKASALEPERLLAMKKFWRVYFVATGAEVRSIGKVLGELR